jgi:uncharacterized protein (TIGR02147 family)
MAQRINIFEYIDYRKYLTDWRLAEKEANPGLSHEYLNAKLGQNNRTFFSNIESDRKNIGSQTINKLITLIGLNSIEANYFRALVGYGQSATDEEKEYHLEQIVTLNNTPYTIVDKDTYSFYTEWYHSSIRALLDVIDTKDDYVKISQLLYSRVTPNQVRDSIKLLKSLDLIAPDKRGFLKPTQKILVTQEKIRHELLHRFQVANNRQLSEILKKDEPGAHDSTQMSVSVSRRGFDRIIKRVNQLKSEIRSIAHKDEEKANRVYKIAIHLYPESKEIVSSRKRWRSFLF